LRNTHGMRSVNAPRVAHDATVEIGAGGRARAVNLSTGGIFVAADETFDPGEQVHLKVNLKDGATPLDVDAEVVWKEDGGMALRFKELDDVAKRRITRLVQKREPTIFGKRDVRIHLPSLPAPLRATARDLTERGVMIEAELPWLRLGSPVTTELSADRACDGKVQWIGLDVTRAGSARLRIFVDLAEDGAEGAPPPAVLGSSDDAFPTAGAAFGASDAPRRNWRWVWPSIAMVGMLACGAMATALLRQPPTPTLLPTAPPEREAPVARLPKSVAVPPQKVEVASVAPTPAATPTPAAATTATATPAAATPAVTAPPPAAAPTKVQHKTRAKKRVTTRRAG
jgi:hypothetical protein